VPSCTGRTTKLFFMLEAHGPPGAMRHMAASEPTSAGRHRTRGSTGVQLSREARSGAVGDMVALELNSVRRRGPES
jgi:hypothetical protein